MHLDSRKRKVLLVRDRFGKKPLYYARRPTVLFRQRIEMPADGRRSARFDTDALRLYFQFTYIAEPYSPFKAIRKLMRDAGSSVRSMGDQAGPLLELPLFRKKTRMGATKPRPANRYASCSMKQYASA